MLMCNNLLMNTDDDFLKINFEVNIDVKAIK